MTFPDFFQARGKDALIYRVMWSQEELRISDEFFLKLLNLDSSGFVEWKEKKRPLSPTAQEQLNYFWQVVLHILSLQNFDLVRVRRMLSHVDTFEAEAFGSTTPFHPPWAGTSMRSFIEEQGLTGVYAVNHWVQGIRFADSY